MSKVYDAVILGGGHNGLVAAASLARAGLSLLVLEKRPVLGGAAATEEFFPGFRVSGAHDVGFFRPEIAKWLDGKNHGLQFLENPILATALQPDGSSLSLWRDERKTLEQISRFSRTDAEKFFAFTRLVSKFASIVQSAMMQTPPAVSGNSPSELFPWLKILVQIRRLGRRDMMDFFKILPMGVAEFLHGWFESDALKGLLGVLGILGSMQGPLASGTAFLFLYHHALQNVYPSGVLEGKKIWPGRFVRGGTQRLFEVLANLIKKHGGEIRTNAPVAKIVVKEERAIGVVLESGEEIFSKLVISNADPRRTFFELVGGPFLEPRFIRRVKKIRYRGVTAKVNLALDALPRFSFLWKETLDEVPSGHIVVSPSLEYLERAYDDAKYGSFSKEPFLDIVIPTLLDPSLAPSGKHVMSVRMQYAPYRLKEGSWEEARDRLKDRIIGTLAGYFPDIKNLIVHCQVITPLDFEREYGLTEGCIFHGQMGLDQLFLMRPVPGYGKYRTPIENLYLCGAGTHPGGGVTGAPGYNAAREVLKDFKKKNGR